MSSLFPLCLILLGLASTVARAELDIESWRKQSLAVAAGTDNNWYFFPDAAKNPRVMVKAAGTTASVTRRMLTGGPPAWTTGAVTTTTNLNKHGVIVPFLNGAYLVAPYNNTLRMTFFNAAGDVQVSELVDNAVVITPVGLSAAVDSGGNLHIAYVGRSGTTSETLRYACRDTSGKWRKTAKDLTNLSQYIRQTSIIPSGSNAANIYASLKTGSVNSLLRVNVVGAGTVVAFSGASNLANDIAEPIVGNRLGGDDQVYYFQQRTTAGFWDLKHVGTTDPIQTIGLCTPTSILCKAGPDAKQRIAWLDGRNRKIHYLRPSGVPSSPFAASQPVTVTTATAQVLGLHFDSKNLPYLLYRASGAQGFIAYPDDSFDSDGNGRPDLIDVAFNSSTAGIQVLPPASSISGFPLSENKFKFRFTTVGSAISNGAGKLFSSSRGITYGVETSTDCVTWTAFGAGSQLFYVAGETQGEFPNEVKTYTAIHNELIPAPPFKRFYRLNISRSASY